jgi:nitric oxide reductase activation protein
MVCMSDGQLDDHSESAKNLAEARRRGVVTFGVFFEKQGIKSDAGKMDELYGPGNWATIKSLEELPGAVGRKIATIFKQLK